MGKTPWERQDVWLREIFWGCFVPTSLIFVCVLAGGLLPLQAAMNAAIGAQTSGPIFATAVNFGVGLVALAITLTALRTPWPTATQMAAVPWWAWFSGFCGIAVVMSTLLAAPKLGASITFAAVIAGQVGVALLCDTFGWLNYQQQELSIGRIIGAVLLVGGVVLIRKF
jgi:transporter family-2 protein